jgi:hypothetical protein
MVADLRGPKYVCHFESLLSMRSIAVKLHVALVLNMFFGMDVIPFLLDLWKE